MFYFEYFPQDVYSEYDGNQMTNILKRFALIPDLEKNENLFDTYTMVQGETLETIAENIYGSSEYSWALLLANKDLHPFYANYKSDEEMTRYIKNKYGVELYKTHHLETLDGTPVDDVDTFYYNQNKYALQYQPIVPVPYDTYERLENESRRIIRYIKNEYLQQIEEEIKNILTKQPDNLSKFL